MAAVSLADLKKEDLKEFLDSFDTVLTDCDGMYAISLKFAYHQYFYSRMTLDIN